MTAARSRPSRRTRTEAAGVGSTPPSSACPPAAPRTPSVPKRFIPGATAIRVRLPLRKLRTLACFLQSRLAAFLHPWVPGQELPALELRAETGLRLDQRLRDPVTDRVGLTGHAPALHLGP